MPHGFNDDKSMFDLDGLTDRLATFTPSAAMTNITPSNMLCVVHGTTGLLTGTVNFKSVSRGTWYLLGTLTDVTVASQSCTRAATMQDFVYSSADVRIDTNGKVYFRPNTYASDDSDATCAFNIMFRVSVA